MDLYDESAQDNEVFEKLMLLLALYHWINPLY